MLIFSQDSNLKTGAVKNQSTFFINQLSRKIFTCVMKDERGAKFLGIMKFIYYPGPSLLIEVNMQVRSMGPISEMDMVCV